MALNGPPLESSPDQSHLSARQSVILLVTDSFMMRDTRMHVPHIDAGDLIRQLTRAKSVHSFAVL